MVIAGALLAMACRDAALPPSLPPTLVKPAIASSMARAPVQWQAGESLAWTVRWRGLLVGTATLGVLGEPGALRIESDFQTVGMAHELHPMRHRLVTRLARASGKIDDLHSALGRLRSWADPAAAPATLRLWHEGRKYDLELAQPTVDRSLPSPRLRVEGRARSGDLLIELTIFLSSDPSHRPLLVTLVHEGQQVSATLLPSDS
jgi:hypothetical protein